MVKVIYNDQLVYKVVIWAFFLNKFMNREGSNADYIKSTRTYDMCQNNTHVINIYTQPNEA